MATAYSNEVSVGSYNRIRIKVDYSGTSATCTLQFRRTSSYNGSWSDAGATLKFNGTTKSASYSYSGTVGTSWVNLKSNISGYSVSLSGGTYSWSLSKQYGQLSGSGSVTIPAQQSAPATPSCSPTASSSNNTLINVGWGCSNLGTPAGSVSLYNGTTNDPTNLLQTKTSSGSWTFGNDQRTPNTEYFYKAVATNSVGTKSSNVVSAITYPAGLTSLTVDSVTSDSVTVTAVYGASGNALTTTAGCRINGSGTWDTIDTDMQGTTKTYTLGPFLPETTNTVEIRVETTVGNSSAASVTFTTPPPVKFYGSVNDQSELVKKMYGSVNGEAKVIKKFYGSVNGEATLIYQG